MIYDRLNAYIEEPEEVESGDGLPPLDITEEDEQVARERGYLAPEFIVLRMFACRERQLKASLLREKELWELLREVKLNGLMPPIDGDLLERIKAAVTGG